MFIHKEDVFHSQKCIGMIFEMRKIIRNMKYDIKSSPVKSYDGQHAVPMYDLWLKYNVTL